jgi:integrase
VVREHLVPTLGHVKLNALTSERVQALYRSKQDSGLSARTVELMHTVLRIALNQAVRWEYLPKNVTDVVVAPTPDKNAATRTSYLTAEQACALLEAARGDRLKALYRLAISTGLREGELLGLRWQDVHLQRVKLSVRQQLTRTKKDGLCFTTPKSAKSIRDVKLTPGTTEVLKAHRERLSEEKLMVGNRWQDSGLVFTTTLGTPLNVRNTTYRSFRPLLERAGLPRIRFHDLRHTCASALLDRNVNSKKVQELLGHANISVKMDILLPRYAEHAG